VDFRDAFYVIKPTTPVATKMIEKGLAGKTFIKDSDGSFILLGKDAIEKAIERNDKAKRPMHKGVVSAKEKDAKRILAFILKEVAGQASEPNEKLVFCIPAQPVDQEDEDFDVGYHEDVVKTIFAECGYQAKAINEAEALCYAELENDDYTGIAISCLVPGTLIYTENGIVDIKDVKENNKVITHKGRWRNVNKVISKKFKGTMTKIQVQGYSNNVENYKFVDNHEIYVKRDGKWSWVGCEELEVGDIIGEPIIEADITSSKVGINLCERTTCSKEYIKKRINSSPSMQRLIGYFLGDGSVNDAEGCIQFDFAIQEKENIKDVREIIKNIFSKGTTETKKGESCIRVKCYSRGLVNYFRNHFYDENKVKFYPWDITKLSNNECLNLLIGMVRSDGVIGEDCLNFGNTNTRLTLLAKQLFSRLGVAASISFREPRINKLIIGRKREWVVSANGKKIKSSLFELFSNIDESNDTTSQKLFIENGFCCSRIQKIDHEEYEGLVYDLQVEEDHSFSGPFMTIHNCGAGMTNVCVMLNGEPTVMFSTTKSGDWIDRMSAVATGENDSVVQVEKEAGGFTIGEPVENNQVLAAVAAYYERLIDYTTKNLASALASHKALPKFKEPLCIVVAGGTSQAKGYIEMFRKKMEENGFPVPIKEVRHASDPLHAVAKGCLIAAKVLG
jgi:intein/homing endonuclease